LIHLYLDDARRCPKGFTLARTAEECIAILQASEVDILSLDYDLGWRNLTGADVARYIAVSGNYPNEIFLHTSSPAGRISMFETLYQAKPEHVRLHNGPMPEHLLYEIASGTRPAKQY